MANTPDPSTPRLRSDAGFSLVEMMISMTLMLVILGGTFNVMNRAFATEKTVRDITTLGANMRAAMDLVTRDMTQVGQGLPTARIAGIPNGAGATQIRRPGPAASGACPGVTALRFNPTTAVTAISAVTPGPNLGPPVNSVCTDVITTLAVDSAFESAAVAAIPNSTSLTVYRRGPDGILGNADDIIIADAPDVMGDNVRVGDFLLVEKGDLSVLVAVTAVSVDTITFAAGDTLGINQTGAAQGTLNWLRLRAPADATAVTAVRSASRVSRVRMITYFVDTTDATSPRLMRQINANAPMAVAFDIETFALNFDLASDDGTWAYVEMNPTDLTTAGRCSPLACSPNAIRKSNISLTGRTQSRVKETGYYRSALTSQVALRSLAFVDKY